MTKEKKFKNLFYWLQISWRQYRFYLSSFHFFIIYEILLNGHTQTFGHLTTLRYNKVYLCGEVT